MGRALVRGGAHDHHPPQRERQPVPEWCVMRAHKNVVKYQSCMVSKLRIISLNGLRSRRRADGGAVLVPVDRSITAGEGPHQRIV